MEEEQEELLNTLNSYGKRFMASFDTSVFTSKRKNEPEAGPSSFKRPKVEDKSYSNEEEEEWTGFTESDSTGEDGEDDSDRMAHHLYEEYILTTSLAEAENTQKNRQPDVVVFSESRSSTSMQNGAKAQLKSFMVCASH